MDYFVYILYSKTAGRYYCGTTDSIRRRLKQHNDSNYRGSLTTKRFPGPWELVWAEPQSSRGRAMIREKQIKKRGIKRFLEGLSAQS